jgi:hypothetical protein
MASLVENLPGPLGSLIGSRTSALGRWLKPLLASPGYGVIPHAFVPLELTTAPSILTTLLADRVFEPLYVTSNLHLIDITEDSASFPSSSSSDAHPLVIAAIALAPTIFLSTPVAAGSVVLYNSSLIPPSSTASLLRNLSLLRIAMVPTTVSSSFPLLPPPCEPLPSYHLAELHSVVPYAATHSLRMDLAAQHGLPQPTTYTLPPTTTTPQLVTLRHTSPLMGQDKWLGGVTAPNGDYVYGVPGGAQQTLKIHVETGDLSLIGPSFPGKFKWLRGVTVPADAMNNNPEYPHGACVCLPSNAKSVLVINPATHTVTTITTEPDPVTGESITGDWLWHGGNLATNGCIYAIPANAKRVLKVDCRNLTCQFIGPTFPMRQKWYGGLLAANGCVYGIPQQAEGVLKIDPATDEVSVICKGELPDTTKHMSPGGWMWHGGMLNKDCTAVYCFPNNSDHILKVCTVTDTVKLLGGPDVLTSGRHRVPQDGRYKYLGGALDEQGNGYCFPCDAERVLFIDGNTDEVRCIGHALLEGENKWQNGFVGEDGAVYAVPQRSKCVLRVVPPPKGSAADPVVQMLDCGEDFEKYKEKFEGGECGSDGSIFCIPLRAKCALKIVPALKE